MGKYLQEFIRPSETISDLEPSFISPSERITVSSFVGSHVKISSTSITDIVNKIVLCLFVIRKRMSSVCSFWEWEWYLLWCFVLFDVMESIITQETTVDVMNVTVSASSIGFIVDDFALHRDRSIGLHVIKIIYRVGL